MVRPSRITPGFHLPRPIYRAPLYVYALRRRRGGIPRPRSPFMHFALDCILQRKITFGSGGNFDFGRISRTIRRIWLRIRYEQRWPWIRMAERDAKTISKIYGDSPSILHGDSGGRAEFSRHRGDTMQGNNDGLDTTCDIAGFEQGANGENSEAINWQRGRCEVPKISILTRNTELPFLELHRRRYSTPERSTYCISQNAPEPDTSR